MYGSPRSNSLHCSYLPTYVCILCTPAVFVSTRQVNVECKFDSGSWRLPCDDNTHSPGELRQQTSPFNYSCALSMCVSPSLTGIIHALVAQHLFTFRRLPRPRQGTAAHRTACPKSNTKGRIPMNTTRKHTNTWKIVYTKRIRTSDRSCPVPDPSTPSPETPLRASLFDGYVAYPALLTRRRPPRRTRHVNTV